MMNNDQPVTIILIMLFTLPALLFGIMSLNDYLNQDENYVTNTYPNAQHIYTNVVTEKDNDFFVVINEDNEENTYHVEVTDNATSHKSTLVTDETPSLKEMNTTSLNTDQRPKRSGSSNSWIPLWLLLK